MLPLKNAYFRAPHLPNMKNLVERINKSLIHILSTTLDLL
jgi:hypothetical protein